jgi:hypothetical protein
VSAGDSWQSNKGKPDAQRILRGGASAGRQPPHAFRGLTDRATGGIFDSFKRIAKKPTRRGVPLRLFGAGSAQVRRCPACERKIKAAATFCPSCYMVFRPEGAAALREFLQGARVPADVYLLRKMQTEDPNAGPVTRVAPSAESPPVPLVLPPEILTEVAAPEIGTPTAPSVHGIPDALSQAQPAQAERKTASSHGQHGRFRSRPKNGIEGLLTFTTPLPPAACSIEDVPALFAWMLDRDLLIPNNLARLQTIHAEVFRGRPPERLGYEEHIQLQVADDLLLHTTEEALGFHLARLAAAYRRAAEWYHQTESGGDPGVSNRALWEMASAASRIRLEAWVYHARYGETPRLSGTRQRELPLKFSGK